MKEKIFKMLRSSDIEMVSLGIIYALNNLSVEECLKIRDSKNDFYYIPSANINSLEKSIGFAKGNICIIIGWRHLECIYTKDIPTRLGNRFNITYL